MKIRAVIAVVGLGLGFLGAKVQQAGCGGPMLPCTYQGKTYQAGEKLTSATDCRGLCMP